MKKSLITLAVASGLLISGAAFADDTTVYGLGQFEVGSYGGDSTGVQTTDNGAGRLGVQSKEDLGAGMAALIRLEYGLDTTQSGKWKARETWIGLKSAYGTLELGQIKSAYKYFGGVKYDPYTATLLQSRGNGGMTAGAYGQNGFLSNSIGYGMSMGAISFRLTYSPDNGGPQDKTFGANGAKGKTLGFGYNAGNFGVIVAYADNGESGNNAAGTTSYKSTKIGGDAKFGAAKVNLQYESTKVDGGAGSAIGSQTIKTTYIDGEYNIDHENSIDLALGTTKSDASGANTEKFSRLAFMHKLSHETKVWVGYRATDSGNSYVAPTAAGGNNTTGTYKDFGPLITGKQSVIALGMQKKF